MRCLIIQEAGHHVENKAFRECFALKYAFIRNGWNAEVWGKGHENFAQTPNYSEYDMLFCIENYSIDWLPDFSKISGPLKVHWIIDLHCAGPSNYINMSNGCDVVLHSTRGFIDQYSLMVNKTRHIWFPNGVDSGLLYVRPEYPKLGGACFVATPHLNRMAMAQYVGAEFHTLLGEGMVKKVSESLVQFNVSVSPFDINYRCWETIALGTVLVTNRVHDLYKLGFEHCENCMIYDNLSQAKDQIALLLDCKELRDRVISNGLKLAAKNSYTFRIRELLKELGLPYTETLTFS